MEYNKTCQKELERGSVARRRFAHRTCAIELNETWGIP